ncbi:ABC transporter permease subunit [Cryptosporangium phraense]|uniref:ABC transporter permease n=1 Tax=Cryptosporangium phraense TaxID=2593070 RepID=A0A545AQM0_9ACTN|nr:ABC transporter permease subunit [Cryptosporangium phraense]TQS43624.1 ABC transporter permease [Cryptosporangium phraense]
MTVVTERMPSLGRLTLVELRKMADTRAGRWLLASVGLITMGLVLVRLFAGPSDTRTADEFFAFALAGSGLLLPVLGILAVTSEWSQRTSLVTFTLVPRRARVVGAKVLAAAAIALASVGVAVVVAVLGNVAADLMGRGGGWDLGVAEVAYGIVFQTINMLMGIAFGALLLASGLAIVLYFVIPTAWSVLGESVAALGDAARWLDLGRTTEPLLMGSVSGGEWGRLASSVGLWVLLPLAAGLVRVLRHEVK